MCRSIKTLRPPFTPAVTEADIRAAALQYVRKVSGFRAPAPHNAEAFEAAVEAVTRASTQLLAALEVRGTPGQRTSSTRTAPGRRVASRESAVSSGASRASASAR
ncbi:MAG TPA: DUF2277 family protein [Kineosporiaceae bacterium]|nr:DUF2277 family protein [Kineosporiaceae bacterium]